MVRKISLCLMVLLWSVATFPQKDNQAKDVLDKTFALFKKSGCINAKVSMTGTSRSGVRGGTEKGDIKIKGDRFLLETGSTITWFDGHTQWSYLISGEEVNISNPTSEELRSINPYSLLGMYRQGFNYKLNGTKTYNGKQVYDITLTPLNRKDISTITLYITKTYQPLYIKVEQKDKSKSEITVTYYQTKQDYPDSFFKFDKKKYPNAEIIDLR